MAESKGCTDAKLSFVKILNVARNEYVKWIINPRLILFFVLYIFIYDYVIYEFLVASERMGQNIMLLEPFIAMANSQLIIMVLPAVFMVLMSDFPKTDGNTMFYIQRAGKYNWMFGQALFGIVAAVSYIAAILVISIVLVARKAYMVNSWSKVVTEYVRTFPNEIEAKVPMLINGRMYNNMTPYKAFWVTITLMLLYLMTVEMVMLISFSTGKRMLGMILGYVIVAVGSSLCLVDTYAKWIFPSAHSIAWMHYDEVLKFSKFNIRWSYGYFLVVLIVMFIISMITVKRYDFAKVTDMED